MSDRCPHCGHRYLRQMEIRKLPREEREAILEACAKRVEPYYRGSVAMATIDQLGFELPVEGQYDRELIA